MDDSERATRRRVLDALAAGPVTGPALADRLDVSRAAVWKHVEALREAGFEVESGDDGYRVGSVPEYGAAAIEFGLIPDADAGSDTETTDSPEAKAGVRPVCWSR